MPKGFVSDEAKEALAGAIKACEARSSAELVVAVRKRSANYLFADLIVGILGAVATTAFLLYAPFWFPLWSFLVDPILVGVALGVVAGQVPAVRRLLTPAGVRREWVRRAAQSVFFDKGLRHTRDHTAILVYVSLTERMAEVVVDTAVEGSVDPRAWQQKVARLQRVIELGGDGVRLARAIEELGDVLEPALERSHDDVNELPDEVCA